MTCGMNDKLFVPKCIDRIKGGSTFRGIEAEEDSHSGGKAEGKRDSAYRDKEGPFKIAQDNR